MIKKESIRSRDLHLIRVEGEGNNSEFREAMKDKYKRIEREKQSKFWVWFYYRMDKIDKKRRIKLRKKIMKNQERGKSLEIELKIMEKNNGKVKNEKKIV